MSGNQIRSSAKRLQQISAMWWEGVSGSYAAPRTGGRATWRSSRECMRFIFRILSGVRGSLVCGCSRRFQRLRERRYRNCLRGYKFLMCKFEKIGIMTRSCMGFDTCQKTLTH